MHLYSVAHKQVAGMGLQFKLSSLNAVVHLVTQEMYIHVLFKHMSMFLFQHRVYYRITNRCVAYSESKCGPAECEIAGRSALL